MAQKKFAWSYSALKTFEQCPRKYYHTAIKKDFVEEKGEQQKWGDRVHKALEERITQPAKAQPIEFHKYLPIADRIAGAPGITFAERRIALDEQFRPVDYFDPSVWVRGIVDVGKLNGQRATLLDYKTGKKKDDPDQLKLFALIGFSVHPEVTVTATGFVWLQEMELGKAAVYRREQMPALWNDFLPRVEALKHARATNVFPPKPSGLCKAWCPVKTCEFHGKGSW